MGLKIAFHAKDFKKIPFVMKLFLITLNHVLRPCRSYVIVLCSSNFTKLLIKVFENSFSFIPQNLPKNHDEVEMTLYIWFDLV